MTRAARRFSVPLALWVGGGLAIVGPPAGAKAPVPFHVELLVRWDRGAGSDAFRDDLSRFLAETLAAGCFAGVEVAGQGTVATNAELAFTVVLSDVVDETRFDDSIAGALQPGDPAKELRREAHFEVTVDAILVARKTGAEVRGKRFIAHVSRRPLSLGEDAQATARADAIDQIVSDLTKALGCGGAKLEKRIRAALGDAARAVPGSR